MTTPLPNPQAAPASPPAAPPAADSRISSDAAQAPRKSTKSKEIGDKDKFLAKMRARFLTAQEAYSDLFQEARRDFQFRAGKQWDDEVLSTRLDDGRPCYTINRIPQFLRQVTGDQKKNRPAIQISAIGDNADTETAEIIQGVVRFIERNSDSDDAKDAAFEQMATGGFGYFRLSTDYSDDSGESLDQEIRFEREADPFAHYPDPNCNTKDYSDSNYWFVERIFPRDAYKDEYGSESEIADLSDFDGGLAQIAPTWLQRDSIRVVEYFWVETEKYTVKKTDPETGEERERVKELRSVFRCETNGVETMRVRYIPGDYIPLVPVLGEELILDGKRQLVGLVRFARTPQQLYNLWQSAMAETIALAPKAPYMATPQQVEGYEEIWDKLNVKNFPYLPVNPDKNAPGWPQRNFGEPPIQAIQSALAHADNDLKSTTGLYDPSLGAAGPEQSGKAILLRQKQGDASTYGFQDAMVPAIKHAGRIIVGWIPHYYDTARIVSIVNPDGTSKLVPINQPVKDDAGLQRVYDLTVGKFHVSVNTGPTLDSMREEAAQSILQLVNAQPELMQVVGDLLVKCMDWPLADEISARLHKMLPPQLQDNADAQVPPQAQAQLAQQAQTIDAMTAALHKLSAKLESKTAELASRERIALMNNRAGIIEAIIKAQSAEAVVAFQEELRQIDRQLALIPDPAAAGADGASAPAPGVPTGPPQPSPAGLLPSQPGSQPTPLPQAA